MPKCFILKELLQWPWRLASSVPAESNKELMEWKGQRCLNTANSGFRLKLFSTGVIISWINFSGFVSIQLRLFSQIHSLIGCNLTNFPLAFIMIFTYPRPLPQLSALNRRAVFVIDREELHHKIFSTTALRCYIFCRRELSMVSILL